MGMNKFITKVHSTDRERRIRHIWRASQLLLEQSHVCDVECEEANYRNVVNSYKVRQSVSQSQLYDMMDIPPYRMRRLGNPLCSV